MVSRACIRSQKVPLAPSQRSQAGPFWGGVPEGSSKHKDLAAEQTSPFPPLHQLVRVLAAVVALSSRQERTALLAVMAVAIFRFPRA